MTLERTVRRELTVKSLRGVALEVKMHASHALNVVQHGPTGAHRRVSDCLAYHAEERQRLPTSSGLPEVNLVVAVPAVIYLQLQGACRKHYTI